MAEIAIAAAEQCVFNLGLASHYSITATSPLAGAVVNAVTVSVGFAAFELAVMSVFCPRSAVVVVSEANASI